MTGEVAQELRRAASALEQQAAVRARLGEAARERWTGPHRTEFDEEHAGLVAAARLLADACRRAALLVSSDAEVLTRAGRYR